MPADTRVRQARLVVTPRYPAEVLAIGALVAITASLTRGPQVAILAGALAIAALLITVLVHEAAHAATAALSGVRVHALTLRGALTASVRRDRVPPGRTAARKGGSDLPCRAGHEPRATHDRCRFALSAGAEGPALASPPGAYSGQI